MSTKPHTLPDLVGKYNQECLDAVSSLYFEKQHQLNCEYKCRRQQLKPSVCFEMDDFISYYEKRNFPITKEQIADCGHHPFCVTNSLDYDFSSEGCQFPELVQLLSCLSFEDNCVSVLSLLKMFFQKKVIQLDDVQADFFKEVESKIPISFDKYTIWNDFVEDDELNTVVKLEFIRLLVQHHPNVHLYMRLTANTEDEVMYDRALIDVDPIYEKFIELSEGGRQMLETLLGHRFELAKSSSYYLFCGWFIYSKIQKEEKGRIWLNKEEMTEFADDYITRNSIETLEWTDTFLYDERELIWSQMVEGSVFPRFLMFMNTFRHFLYTKVKPEDRERFCFAGSMVKALYKIRDVQDIDFLVSDTNGKIEQYGSFAPKLGTDIKGVMDDFGRTYYAIEKFYFPMIPDLYKKQTNAKVEQRKDDNQNDDLPQGLITNLVPKFSASGLKAGRYIDIYARQINVFLTKMGLTSPVCPEISSLDDILFYPAHHFSIGGIKFLPLEYEVIRDHMKDLDLKRVSRKQMMDFCEINQNYSVKQEQPELWSKLLGIDNFRFEKANLITNAPCSFLEWNLYHGNLLEGKYFEVLIRRSPLKLAKAVSDMVSNGLFQPIGYDELPVVKTTLFLSKISKGKELTAVVHTKDDWQNNQRFMSNVLSTSIPSKIQRFKEDGSVEIFSSIWNYVITDKGQLNICLITNPYELGSWAPSFVRPKDKIISAGQLKIVDEDDGKQIHFNMISPDVIAPIFKRFGKKYEDAVYHFTKSVFQLHRLFDTLADKKITIHYDTKSFSTTSSNYGGFTNRVFKTNKVDTMKLWQEQTKKNITDPLPLQEYLKATASS